MGMSEGFLRLRLRNDMLSFNYRTQANSFSPSRTGLKTRAERAKPFGAKDFVW